MPLNGRAYIYALFTINVISASFGNLSQTAVNVMMTSITAEMGVGVDVGQWLTTAYMLVIGAKEAEDGTVAVRKRHGGDLGAMKLDAFIARLQQEIDDKVQD